MQDSITRDGGMPTLRPIPEDEARARIYAAPLGDVPPLAPLHEFLVALLAQHPRAEVKRGAGVRGFRVVPGAYGKSRAVALVRVDGTEDLFSWLKCCRGATDHKDISAAYREAVEAQVVPLRVPGLHVDHADPWPFAAIVRAFEAEHGRVAHGELLASDVLPWRQRLPEPRRSAFAEFHRQRAVLVAIPAADNLRKKRGGR